MGEELSVFFGAWELFREPTLAGAIAGCVLGIVGVWIVLRRMVFLAAALSQTAGFGVAIAFFIHALTGSHAFPHPGLGAAVLTIAAALLLARRQDGADGALGILFLGASAGTLAISGRVGVEAHDIDTLLFGSAVAVMPEQFWWLVGICCAIFVVHAWWWRGFAMVTVDRDDAAVRGVPVRLLERVLVGSAALGVATTTWVLGALPAFAFSVLPGIAALALARNVATALILAGCLGAIAGFGGYLAAFVLDLPVGACQTLVGLVEVGVCAGLARLVR